MITRTAGGYGLVAALAVLTGVVGCNRGNGGPEGAVFRGGEPPLSVSLAYPPSWRPVEERGRAEPYAALRLLGPRNAEDTYTASIVVRGTLSPRGVRAADEEADEPASRYLSQLIDGAVVESDARRRQWGTEVRDLTVAYTVPPLHRSGLKPVPIPVRTRMLFLRRGEYAYQVAYSADAREYAAHQDEFDALVASLRFR